MNTNTKISCFLSAIRVRFLSRKLPLVVSWFITNRCNKKCQYCDNWNTESEELGTKEIFKIINGLKELGTRIITLEGGEALLRQDIGQIIDYTHEKGIFIVLLSNGALVPDKIKEVGGLDLLKLSLDGPEEIHDSLRGKGSYQEVIRAAEIAKENRIPVNFSMTLNKYNIDAIDFVLDMARKLDIKVGFQPVNHVHAKNKDINFLFPDKARHHNVITRLIGLKKSNPYIINSRPALEYLYNWPEPGKFKCFAGRIICCLMPEGKMFPCASMRNYLNGISCLSASVKNAFNNLQTPVSCKGCWCASTLELNCLMNLELKSFLQVVNF